MCLTFRVSRCIKYVLMNTTSDQLQDKDAGRKRDVANLLVLLALATAIGIYLIASTVLISKDGVLYIEQAKLLSSDSATVMKSNTPGYPMLLFAAHRIVAIFCDNSSLFGWIYTAQGVTLLSRLMALVPLYLIGKRLVEAGSSFYAMLILILLPYPAKMSCELTREWPYLLFLATGFLLLLRGAAHTKWWMFGAVGLLAGLAHVVRPEGAQLLVFGILWLVVRLIRPGRELSRARVSIALAALLIAFVIPVAPYAKARGRIIPDKVRDLIGSSRESETQTSPESEPDGHETYATAGLLGGSARAIYELAEKVSENLLYFFVPPMLIGFYLHFRRRRAADGVTTFFVSAFIASNIVMPILLHQHFGYMSRRHALPLALMGVLYVPSGLRAISDRLEREIFRAPPPSSKNSLRWFSILLIIGFAVCLPKLLRPVGAEKQGYRDAADWLKNNTEAGNVIAVPDSRISFYAERQGLMYENDMPEKIDYAVMVTGSSDQPTKPGGAAREVYSVGLNRRQREDKRVVVYKMM